MCRTKLVIVIILLEPWFMAVESLPDAWAAHSSNWKGPFFPAARPLSGATDLSTVTDYHYTFSSGDFSRSVLIPRSDDDQTPLRYHSPKAAVFGLKYLICIHLITMEVFQLHRMCPTSVARRWVDNGWTVMDAFNLNSIMLNYCKNDFEWRQSIGLLYCQEYFMIYLNLVCNLMYYLIKIHFKCRKM